jgi:hypothetical protein
VRFEPTPAGGAEGIATDAPTYTTLPVNIGNETAAPSATNSEADPGLARDSNEAQPTGAENAKNKQSSDQGSFPWAWLAGGVVLVLLAAAVALGPRTIRRRRRDQRGLLGPEEAWQELRDTAIDLRLAWPNQRSPWQTREALVQLFGAPRDEFTPDRPRRGPDTNPDAVMALDRIVHSLERLRYARPSGQEAGTWRAVMQTCVEALYGGAPKRARRAADWWPRSVFSRQVDVRRPFDDTPLEPSMAGRVVDHVG